MIYQGDLPDKKYQIIYADPPWDIGTMGVGRDTRPNRYYKIGSTVPAPYPTMPLDAIIKLPVARLSEDVCHLWLWTTNRSLHDSFHVMEAWGFKYLNILTFNKPSGIGAWFINTTQHLLFGYKGKLAMGNVRYTKTSQQYIPQRHSKKPDFVYNLIEAISPYNQRIELFARQEVDGWDCWGNEITVVQPLFMGVS